LQVTRDDLQGYYNQHRDEYRVPEQVEVSHIWIKMPLPGEDGKIDEKGVADASTAPKPAETVAERGEVRRCSQEIFRNPGSSNVGVLWLDR